MVSFAQRVQGAIYGTAYGDAMGAVVEKMTYSEIKEKYGRVETTQTKWWKADWPEAARQGRMRGQGIITDDTLMTLALMNVYVTERRHLDAYDMANEFVKEIAFRPTVYSGIRPGSAHYGSIVLSREAYFQSACAREL
ncbi:ADP-ribosylglycohydrolase family protein [Paenibacillus sp. KS1]|uniref:ADP-ribosylglycohydrolase family protein n=1 Tax=Paenibacillus sp. KS1 TaxID=1849249 RepID=UPI0026819A7E